MTFTIVKLAGDRALVKGRDAAGNHGQQILDAAEWNEFTARNNHVQAHDAFDAAVEEFFAPLNAAVDALKETAKPKLDPLFFVTVQEGSPAVEATHEVLVHLHQHSAILRLIEQDPDTDRLLWINDTLEILDLPDTPAQVKAIALDVTNEDGTEDEGLTKA
jgi:predicted transcriptional regulator